MTHNTPFWFPMTALVGALSAGCAAHPAQPKTVSVATHECKGSAIASASDLARFTGCTKVAGDLAIVGTGVRDLTALRSLRSISGSLTIAQNAHLRSLEGLSALSRATVVTVEGNPELETLEGLEGLTRLRVLEVRDNGIHTTAGLGGLRQVQHLTIAGNRQLISLAGLNELERAASVTIEHNPLLCADFGLLDGLSEVRDKLLLQGNYGISARDESRLQAQVGRPAAELKLGLQELASAGE